MGALIVLEGIDGSGKSTQFKLLCERLDREGADFTRLTFPSYDQPSSALVKMYLDGQFGEDPGAVNPYAASSFFAVDRFASFIKFWRGVYERGGLVITDRYTTSNAIHQGAKLHGDDRARFFNWLREYEFGLLSLPAPDAVIYMDIPVSLAYERCQARTSDIHERNLSYLGKCALCGSEAVDFFGWHRVNCLDGLSAPRSEGEIHAEICDILRPYCASLAQGNSAL